MDKHSANALEIAKALESNSKVKRVNYPGLESNRGYSRAQKYFKDGKASALLSFEVESYDEAKRIIDSTDIFSVVTNIGDSKSLIVHPASTTHSQLTKEELDASGVGEAVIRLSVGLEDSGDLIADLVKAIG